MYARRVDPSALAFSLASHRHSRLAFALLIHNKQNKTGGSEPGSTMWGHRVGWLPRERGGSGAFGAGPPYHPRQEFNQNGWGPHVFGD